MSKISDIYDFIEGKVVALLPSHKELSNPYFPETTADIGYNAAYGLAFGAGSNAAKPGPPGIDSKMETKTQDFIVSLTRRMFTTKKDTTTRKTVEKLLMEDQSLLTNSVKSDKSWGDGKLMAGAVYVSHDGIEFVRVDRQDIIIIRTLLQIEYHEPVS